MKDMKQELEDQLAKDFPFMIAKNVWTGEVCCDDDGNAYGFPCSVDDGWYQLIHGLCQELTDLYIANERDPHKPDIAAYFPVAFMSTKGMGVRWWIPVTSQC